MNSDIAEYNTETSDKKQEIALTVHLDNTDYPTLTLCAYQYDGENCLVTLNDTTLGFAACNSQTASPFGCLNNFYFKILSNFWGSLQIGFLLLFYWF